MTNEEKAYAAGLFEGEGSVQIGKCNLSTAGVHTYRLQCCVTMADEEPLSLLRETWGGSITRHPLRGEQWRPTSTWITTAKGASIFLEDVEPFLRMERMKLKAATAIEFQAQKRTNLGRKHGPERDAYNARQEEYYWVMRKLNQRGADSLFARETA